MLVIIKIRHKNSALVYHKNPFKNRVEPYYDFRLILTEEIFFFLVNSFLVLVTSTKCIISFCFYTTCVVQTLICDNLWNFSPKGEHVHSQWWCHVSSILPSKSNFPPSWLLDPMTILFHSPSKSGISGLTYWVTLTWKIRSIYYYICF